MSNSFFKAICEAGHYQTGTRCDPCGVGFYQSKRGMFYCDACAVGQTTRGEKSTSQSECYGEFYQKANLFLEKKILENNFEFFASNDLLITLLDLSDDCNPGYELAPNGTCVLCPLGTYRTLGTPAVCSACPSDKTTPNTGSTKASDCSLSKYQSYNIQNLKHSKSSY